MIKRILFALTLLAAPASAQTYPNPKFNTVIITGTGSTGDVSAMNVTAQGATVPRALSAINGDTIKAIDFGSCTWSAVTDVGPCINAATAYAASIGGGVVELPKGTFGLATTITSPTVGAGYSQILLKGQRYSTTLTPIATITSMASVTNGNFSVEGISFANSSSFATNAIYYNKTPNNLKNTFEKNSFTLFTNAINMVTGDDFNIDDNFFNSNTTAINFTGLVINGSVTRNYVLNGNGWDIGNPSAAGDVEGVSFSNNSVLPATNGSFSVRIRWALAIKFNNELYDQNNKASVVGIFLDGSTQTIRDIKVSNTWIGGSAGAGSFGIKAIGGVSDLGLMGVRVEGMGTCFSGDGSPGYMIATNITGLSCFNSTTTDLSLGNIGGSIRGSYFTATTPVTDTTNNSMIVVGNSFTSLPRHQGATSQFLFNYGDTSAELQISGSASTSVTPLVNYVKITGSPTGGLSAISAAGTDTNIPLGFFTKNAADVIFYTNNNAAQFVVQNNISATNFVSVTGSTGSNPVVIRPNNGAGNASMQFQAAGTGTLSSNKPIVTLSTTVSSLGTCSASNDGASWGVTDSTVSLFGATLVGGGANHVPAYCNGTNWVVR